MALDVGSVDRNKSVLWCCFDNRSARPYSCPLHCQVTFISRHFCVFVDDKIIGLGENSASCECVWVSTTSLPSAGLNWTCQWFELTSTAHSTQWIWKMTLQYWNFNRKFRSTQSCSPFAFQPVTSSWTVKLVTLQVTWPHVVVTVLSSH